MQAAPLQNGLLGVGYGGRGFRGSIYGGLVRRILRKGVGFLLQGLRSFLPECLARVPEDLRILLCLELLPLSAGAQVEIETKV